MLAQDAPVSFAPVLAALTAALVVTGPVSVAVTKVVDFFRNLVDANQSLPKWVWNILAIVLGLALALGWNINVFDALLSSIPALSDSDVLAGTAGTILTGLFVGAMAGFWHEKMSQWSAASGVTVPIDGDVVVVDGTTTTGTRKVT